LHSSDIRCHCCQGLGQIQRECLSKRTYVATAGGGYISTFDVDDEDIVVADITGDDNDHETSEEEIIGAHAMEHYRTIIVQRSLSTQVDHADKIQRHNLFHIFFVNNDCRVLTINNLVNSEVVKKLGLTTRAHPHPYNIQWFNNSGKVKVTQIARVHFSIGLYHAITDFDVVPMDACSLLLGCPWEFDADAIHNGRTNTYTLMHKGKKITLVLMTHADIVKCEQDKAKQKGVVGSETQQPKKLKQPSFLAMKMDLIEIVDVPDACYALLCKRALFSLDDASVVLPPIVANLLQEYIDVFPSELPLGIPPLRGIEYKIDLVLGASLPNHAAYKANPEETKEIQRQVQDLLDCGYNHESLNSYSVPVLLVHM
jgi:hypothetical protein